MTEQIKWAAAAIAVGASLTILGALFFQFVLGYQPCPLCLDQRIAYYVSIPLAIFVILGESFGASRKVVVLAFAAIAVAMVFNAGLGVYHSGIEWKLWAGPPDCSGPLDSLNAGGGLLSQLNTIHIARCDSAAWRFFGLSLAGYNVLISLLLAAVALWGLRARWQNADPD